MSIRPWAVWRRSMYISAFLLFVTTVSFGWYFTYIYKAPTCFDNKMNGAEAGIDCGGACVRICAASVQAPEIIWAQSFKIAEGQYNTVAYIDNRNQLAGTPELAYTFELLSNGEVVASRSGKTVLPPNTTYPLFEGRILVDANKPITDTVLIIDPSPLWLPATVSYNQFRSLNSELVSSDVRPRLNVEMENTDLSPAKNVEVVATIFNAEGNPVTASQTFIELIEGRSTQDIVFTWPRPIAKTVRSCILPTDIAMVIDLSGSMNNDNDNPPQPLTDALQAASTFVSGLSTKDRASLVTFATEAQIYSQLSSSHADLASTITALTIAPESETGFTNTLDALELANTELSSERHNENARRVIVLLTDGLPTTDGDEDVITPTIEMAHSADAGGVEIYAIGLGQSVDRSFISEIASSNETAYFAPSSSDLNSIYESITNSLCESGAVRIDVLPKPLAEFPLQN